MPTNKTNMKRLSVITGNMKKLDEIVKILGPDVPFEIVHRKIDLPEYQGDLEYIVREKCKHACMVVQGPVVVEDTSLAIKALGELPGPYIKWFIEKIHPVGIYRMVKDWEDKSATAICMMSYAEGVDKPIHVFKGTVKGTIVEPRGDNNFGWDPCFQPDGFQETFAEMDESVKNIVSHRFHALKALQEHFLSI